jgi:serine/threonine protein kinase
LSSKYPGASSEALDFLSRVLVFNPYFRISLQECLDHPLFSQVRNIEKEKIPTSTILLEFEKEELNRDKLRQLIL